MKDNQKHPECERDEVYIGNCVPESFEMYKLKDKRMGKVAYDCYWKELPMMYPVFVKIQCLPPIVKEIYGVE